jgi:diaminopimelate epimerase
MGPEAGTASQRFGIQRPSIEFAKYAVCGNDFVFIFSRPAGVALSELARAMCDRHAGAGADQLVLIERGTDSLAGIEIFNPDGSRSPFCANATLAAGFCACRRWGLAQRRDLHIGELRCDYLDGGTGRAGISMPSCILQGERVQRMPGSFHEVQVTCGTYHYVVLMPTLDGLDLEFEGARLEHSARAGGTTNVMFVQCAQPGRARVIPWERSGSGATLACGSGAMSVAAVLADLQGDEPPIAQHWWIGMPGGELEIHLAQGRGELYGEPDHVYSGRYFIEQNHIGGAFSRPKHIGPISELSWRVDER